MRPLKRYDNELKVGDGGAPRVKPRWGIVAQLVFWSWNGLLATVALFGLVPVLGIAFARDSVEGRVPPSLCVALLGLVLMPLACIAAGIRLSRDPLRLLALFYGLEVPLLFIGIIRLFLVREVTTQLAVAGTLTLLGLAAFAATMVVRRGNAWLFAGVSVLGLASVGFAFLGALYAVPIFVTVVREIPGSDILRHPEILIYMILGVALLLYTASLVIASPVVATFVYVAALRRLAGGVRRRALARSTLLVAAIAVIALNVSATQPHERAFALLATPPTSDAERTQLLAQSATIRAGLLDAYLSGYRYVSATGDSSALAQLWSSRFGGIDADYQMLARFNDFMVAPFLFNAASPWKAVNEAATAYTSFFDADLEETERERIAEAISASFERSTVGASLLDRDAERVLLRNQDLRVTPHGDWAEIEVHEEYVNVTPSMQEVLYHFELPESAVVTGLWLGETNDKATANVFQVAPRGAAQRVYREAQARAMDPALLEQVGPRQYRLRVFPILPETAGEAAQPSHLWLRVAVFRDGGQYPLPHLGERRNVFFSGTYHTMNGSAASWAGWLPEHVAAPATPSRERLANVDGFGVRVAPLNTPLVPLTGLRVRVVVDRSRSMEKHAAELTRAIAEVRTLLGTRNDVDVVLAAAKMRGESVTHTSLASLRPIVFYGGQALSDMLRETVGAADLTVVLTDDDGVKHELDAAPLRIDSPLWLVHLGGAFPAAYADVVTDVLARPHSGVAASVEEAVAKFTAARVGMLVDGERLWSLVAAKDLTAAADGTDPLMARALVRLAGFGMVARDAHRVAVDHAIVTPVSSMIVLVTDAQREALERQASSSSAFDRQTETGTVPHAPAFVTGVPEPEEWLLLAFVAVLLVAAARRYRTMMSSGSTYPSPTASCVAASR